MTRTGGKILRCAQNDRGERLSFGGALPLSVILRGASPPLSVILRSFAPKNLSYHVFVTGEKILRCAQNDKGERLSFGGALLPSCHSEELRSEESFGPCP